jgi:hypothetical protein
LLIFFCNREIEEVILSVVATTIIKEVMVAEPMLMAHLAVIEVDTVVLVAIVVVSLATRTIRSMCHNHLSV